MFCSRCRDKLCRKVIARWLAHSHGPLEEYKKSKYVVDAIHDCINIGIRQPWLAGHGCEGQKSLNEMPRKKERNGALAHSEPKDYDP